MRIVSIASGSKGNAYLVESGGESVLIDCGVPFSRLKPFAFSAVLLTHSHTDHISGLSVLLKHRDVPVYANAMTAESVASLCKIDESAFCCFENGQPFDLGGLTVSPFSIPHDTADPVGYLLRSPEGVYFHGTDIGTPLRAIGLKFAEADVATLESNHDPVMLKRSGRPPSLIQRIAGERGHLSNDQSADLVRTYASPRLKRLALAHLSQDCNQPYIAEETMRRALAEMKRQDVALTVLPPDGPVEY